MKRPPMLMHFEIRGEKEDVSLWLPLFLLLPLAIVVLIIMSPLILIGVLVLWPGGWGKSALLISKAAFVILFSMRGLKVDIKS